MSANRIDLQIAVVKLQSKPQGHRPLSYAVRTVEPTKYLKYNVV